jgi:hypothetical protein
MACPLLRELDQATQTGSGRYTWKQEYTGLEKVVSHARCKHVAP